MCTGSPSTELSSPHCSKADLSLLLLRVLLTLRLSQALRACWAACACRAAARNVERVHDAAHLHRQLLPQRCLPGSDGHEKAALLREGG